MIRVKVTEPLSEHHIETEIDFDLNDELVFSLELCNSWYSLSDINKIIKHLNKMKRIHKTRTIEGE